MQTKKSLSKLFTPLLRYGVLPPIFIGLVITLRIFVFIPLEVNTDAMAPTLSRGAWLLANRYQTPKVGDIILYTTPNIKSLQLARLVGMSGDSTQIQGDCLWTNGKLVYRYKQRTLKDYKFIVPRKGITYSITSSNLITYRPIIAKEYQVSIDSIKWEQGKLWIKDKATTEIKFSEDYYWLLIDNPQAENSSHTIGLIPTKAIAGTVFLHL